MLISPNNSIYLLHLNKTEEKLKEKKYYLDLTYNNINFLSNYLYNFLPKIFLYPQIATEKYTENNGNIAEEQIYIHPVAKTVATKIQDIADKTYKFIANINLYDYVLSKIMIYKLKEKIKFNEMDEMCLIIMQKY